MEKIKDIRYQNIALTIPNAQVINSLLENSAALDQAYNRITGISVVIINDATLGNNLLIGARSNRKTWVDLVPRANWNAETSVSPNGKFLDCNIGYGNGDTFYLQAQNLAVPGAAVQLYMTLRLESDMTEMPR